MNLVRLGILAPLTEAEMDGLPDVEAENRAIAMQGALEKDRLDSERD